MSISDVDRAVDPEHYKNAGIHTQCGKPIEVKDISGELPGFLSQAVQYILRAGKKDDVRQEIRKAITFLEFELERIDKHEANRLEGIASWDAAPSSTSHKRRTFDNACSVCNTPAEQCATTTSPTSAQSCCASCSGTAGATHASALVTSTMPTTNKENH